MIAGLALLLAGVVPAAGSQITWHNVTLGAPASTLRPLLGDPLRIVPVEKARIARYWLAGADSTYLLVIEEHGRIVGFEAFSDTTPSAVLGNVPPDPSSVRLGDTIETVKAKHPEFVEATDERGSPTLGGLISPIVGVRYEFQDRRVRLFHWGVRISDSQPELPPLEMPAGDSFANAIVDLQQNEMDGVAWEYRYLAFHPCADNARWQLKSQALIKNGGRAYDRLHVVCPTTKAERDFYFDITSYFGKLD